MIGESLRKLFGGKGRAEAEGATPGLTQADRRAVAEDLACFDAAEPGLGEALTRYVLTGEDSSALLRVEALVRAAGGSYLGEIGQALQPYGKAEDDRKATERAHARRARALTGMDGFEPGVLRRYGELFAYHYAGGHRYNFPGSDHSPLWLRTVVELIDGKLDHRNNGTRPRERGFGPLTAPRILAMMEEAGETDIAALVDCAFVAGTVAPYAFSTERYLEMDGFADALRAHPGEAVAAIAALGAEGRVRMLALINREELIRAEEPFFEFAFAAAGDGSRAVRDAAITALEGVEKDRLRERAEAALKSRKSGERLAAVNVLIARGGPESLPILEKHEAGGEKSKVVIQAIATARASAATLAPAADGQVDGPEGYTAFDGSFVDAPPPPAQEPTLPADLEKELRAAIAIANEAAKEDYARTPPGKNWNQRPAKPFKPPFDNRDAAFLLRAMRAEALSAAETDRVRSLADHHFHPWQNMARREYDKAFAAILSRPDLPLAVLMRLMVLRTYRYDDSAVYRAALQGDGYPYGMAVREISRRLRAGGDFRVVAAQLAAGGKSFEEVFHGSVGYSVQFPEQSRSAANPTLWPVLCDNLPVLDQCFGGVNGRARGVQADAALLALSAFPRLPRRYFNTVLDRAAQGQKGARAFARWLLREVDDLTPVIAPMLEAGTEAVRVAGARWMAERRDAGAVPLLRARLVKEKGVAATAAIVSALSACGDDVSDQFEEEKLLKEARTGIAKTKADFSALFDPENLPVLHWADGRAVPPELVRWWFVRAHKLKAPAGDPMLHMALDRLAPADREKLGRDVVAAFVAFDTARPTSEEANAYAAEGAPRRFQSARRYRKDLTEEMVFAEMRREKLSIYLNSALDHRGLLGLARDAPPVETAAIVKRFLRDHGKRANQCRALVDMLMADPAPVALQVVLAASQRHKQPGLRKYAGEVTAAYAEERGWTPAELGDRTVPACGLDEAGILELPIGERIFRARLESARAKKGGEELRLTLLNPDDKPVASLPSPSDPDEATEAKDAKATLSAAKKELKQTAEMQTRRLYEAMCTSRVWPVADARDFLIAHPVMRRLLSRLVLAGLDEEGRIVASFRLLEDGSFTDAEDAPVAIEDFAGIVIAHRATLGEAASARWAEHLADYEVTPLFEQFQRPALGAGSGETGFIEDRRGHMIDNSALRSAAEGLGYGRGSVEDGAGFYAYEKSYPDLGLVAVIEFSGSYIGETERVPKYLTTLAFERTGGRRMHSFASGGEGGIALSDVPPVLLSESWNDYREIATRGTGFDPDHEKKAGW